MHSFFFPLVLHFAVHAADPSTTWTFDRIESAGGHSATIVGHPRVIDTPLGKAIQFDSRSPFL